MTQSVSSMTREPVLSLRGVSVHRRGRALLDGVDLDLAPGEVLGIIGPNGAGKTTLLRAASGVIRIEAGRIRLLGRELGAYGARERARALAVVPQDVQLGFGFTVGEVVLMGRTPHASRFGLETRDDVARARAALEQLDIGQLADRSMPELSGGERQLALVARALAQDPAVLLLDEPTSHLDLQHRVAVAEVVGRLAAAGRSALVVSHDLTLAARSCDRLALLAEGRVLASGAPRQVLTPERLAQAFGLQVDVLPGPDGAPLVVPSLERGTSPVDSPAGSR